jgi:hypothetical protein
MADEFHASKKFPETNCVDSVRFVRSSAPGQAFENVIEKKENLESQCNARLEHQFGSQHDSV